MTDPDLTPVPLHGNAKRVATDATPRVSPAKYQELLARSAVSAARLGDPYPLIGRLHFCLQTGEPLSDDEIHFIVDALKATIRKPGTDNLRKIERFLITERIEGLKRGGMKQEAAITEVMRRRGRSRRHVYNALKAREGG